MSDQITDEANQVVAVVPQFDIALWGYDRDQVDECLVDLATRLEQALIRLDAVDLLHNQLSDAQRELAQLRQRDEPTWSVQLGQIMQSAEELRRRAEHGSPAASVGD